MAGLPPRLLRTPDAARFLESPTVPWRSIDLWHRAGLSQDRRRVVYAVEDLQALVSDRRAQVDTDQTAQRVFRPAD